MAIGYLRSAWWLLLLRGIALIFPGIIALALPGATIALIVMILGLYLIVDGIIEIVMGIASIGKHSSWVWTMIKGILAIILGVMIFRYTGISVLTLVFLFGIWLIIRGFLDFSVFGNKELGGGTRSLAIIAGLLSIIAGILLLFKPIAGTYILAWVFGIYAIIAGPLMIATAISIKSAIEDRRL